MPTKLPTQPKCLNCNYEVKQENKYCPKCGQENANKRISIAMLLQDAFATAFNFESRVFKTIPLFLFYPGKLTKQFLEGKRVCYMHPFKIYLLSSILFFFVIIKLFTPSIENAIRNLDTKVNSTNMDITMNDSTVASNEDNSTVKSVQEDFEEGWNMHDKEKNTSSDSISKELELQIAQKQKVIQDSISKIIANFNKGKLKNQNVNVDSLENLLQDSAMLSNAILLASRETKKKQGALRRFFRLIKDRNMTPNALLDSLNTESKKEINIQIAEQLLKIGRNDPAIFLADIVNNIGTLMFFTLPILAFFFVPFYIRRNKYYIDHLIFTLHLQAFTFVILTLAAIFFHWSIYFMVIVLCLILIIYVWIAFKRVYQQGFFKTTIKASMISFLYALTLAFMLIINLLYSFFMF
ncbi:DUF3667 domain-containing protein [Bernardetia sp.]|uniref:DUF3667 domain-containing protein n=1 Tax=Bernardetia sp. TaxID=1937974 RepID=UPI0025BEF8A9|nr:DUF3667 domain-containing protein [Bernardetia sp.]